MKARVRHAAPGRRLSWEEPRDVHRRHREHRSLGAGEAL